MIDLKNIKIVIWDLDETFWKGTLSEGPIVGIQANINLVKRLTDLGIVNSICSKNDFEPTIKTLSSLSDDIAELFVFPSINWLPKGNRIKEMLKTMGLRPQNALFIDDNIHNLEDAKFVNPDLMTAGPEDINHLIRIADATDAQDKTHKRLKQYKILEEKAKAAENFSDNTEFLYSSNIQVQISRDCQNQIDRIVELVQRSNQLNFTKKRDTKEEIEKLIQDTECDTGYVTVKDNFGDYGMVGFFAVKNNICIHLLFSCRTIGQGVEEYVYATLGYPELVTVEPVINHLDQSPAPGWINQTKYISKPRQIKTNTKIVFKGACDLMQMCEYLDSDSIVEEFTYIGKLRNNYIEHHNHSLNYLVWHDLSESDKKELVDKLVFNDKEMFNTAIYDKDVALVILSTMIEPHMGIYRHKSSGFKIAFGDAKHPLTDKSEWNDFKNNKLIQGSKYMTDEWLQWFHESFEFLGPLSLEEILDNAKKLLKLISENVKICYLLGPEINRANETDPTYIGREKIYAAINAELRKLSDSNHRVMILDSNKWIHKSSDLTNNINHWDRRVYYQLALEANKYIREISGKSVKNREGVITLFTHIIKDKISATGFFQTKFWSMISKLRHS